MLFIKQDPNYHTNSREKRNANLIALNHFHCILYFVIKLCLLYFFYQLTFVNKCLDFNGLKFVNNNDTLAKI